LPRCPFQPRCWSVLLRPEWMPCGKELAGEDDLSGLSAGVLLHFAP
jgi:hypothetical protein